MNKKLLILPVALCFLFAAACGQQAQKGTESSIYQVGDIKKVKVIADKADVRTGCSTASPVVQSPAKDTQMDVLSKVADWYAVKLPNNQIGFVPQQQCKPIVADNPASGAAPGTDGAAPQSVAGSQPAINPPTTNNAAKNTKQATPDNTQSTNTALTAQEQEMLNLVNQVRAQNGAGALQADPQVTNCARVKSQDMIDNNYFSHNSPKYGSPFDMMKSFGIGYVAAAENIAGNQTVQKAHEALMNSPGHRKNILNPEFTHIGIGIKKGGSYGNMFTQMFISKPK